MPGLKRAELIGGIVYLPSPVGLQHSDLTQDLNAWVAIYKSATPGCRGSDNATWLMASDSPQPDIALFIRPEYGGACRYEGAFVTGAPELIIEVSATTQAFDFGPKLRLYREAGVREYVSVVPPKRTVVWRVLEGGDYSTLSPDSEGVYRSAIFPGLWLNAEAIFNDDAAALFATLQQGIASPEHARFAAQLAARRS